MVAAALLLASLALFAHLATRSEAGGPRAADPGRAASAGEGAPAAAARPGAVPDEAPVPRAGPLMLPPRRVEEQRDLLASTRPEQLEGSGRIRVRARARTGAAFPEHWTLHAGPAAALIGGERAERRTLELAGDQREVLLEDLPLGGYELSATAPTMNSEAVLVLLARPDRTEATIDLVLNPAGYVTGTITTQQGEPVFGLQVSLASLASGTVWNTATDAQGGYHFAGVLNGDYRLAVGDPRYPLVPPRELAFQAPTLTMKRIEVPPLAELEVRVLDVSGLLVAGASVQGWSAQGGRIDGLTGPLGVYSARFLPPGEYTVVAKREGVGRGRARASLAANEAGQVEVRIEP